MLPVGDGHTLALSEYGNAGGIPALLLHGGPGSGSTPLLRRFFDPACYRIVCLDQRGAGASRPRGGLVANTTAHLIEDLRRIRAELGIERWLVVGGSWGATLALAYAAAEPGAVDGLLLRASFLARRADIDGFFQGAQALEPDAWKRFAAVAPEQRRGALLDWLAETLTGADTDARERAALAWWHWEQALAGTAGSGVEPDGAALAALVDRYRVQSHYLRHDCWLAAPTLLERCEALPRVPTLLLHGRADRICPPAGALALQQRIAHAELRWVDGAGHDPAHPAMAGAMRVALDAWTAGRAGARDFGPRA